MRVLTRIVDWFATPYSLYLLIRDPEISWKVKIKAGLILAAVSFYILNPWDLIPEFTPVIGWLDDLIIIPLAMALAAKIVPEVSVAEIRQKARRTTKRMMFWTITLAVGLILIGLSTLGLLVYTLIKTLA